MRTKIIAGNLAALLVVGLVSYFLVKSSVETQLASSVDSRIASEFQLLDRSFRLSSRELAELVESQSNQRALMGAFVSALDVTAQRNRAYEAAERTAAWLADPARRGAMPDVVVVVADNGRVVARNADRNRLYDFDIRRAVPAVARALAGDTSTGIWNKEDENKVLQVAVAPIRGPDMRVLGALLVGYDVSNGLARAESRLLGRDVAFLVGERVYSSSFGQSEETEALRAHLFGAGQAATAAAFQGATSSPFTVTLGGSQYVGVVGPAPADGAERPLAMVVLGNRSAQLAKASSTNLILLLTAFGALVVVAYGLFLAAHFIRPVEAMEETILAAINGRTDARIHIESAELGGLAYRINQLLNVFTGTPEGDENGGVSQGGGRWQDESIAQSSFASPGSAPAASSAPTGEGGEDDPALVAQLAAEPEATYYARVYQEYVAAKEAAGEDVSNIPQDKFEQRLRANEQSLVKKHNCRMVRFQVQTRGTQVNLKPVIIP